MSGLEVVVRPVVFPNIRPQQARVLPPLDDQTQGFASITGGSGRVIDLPHTYSLSITRQTPHTEVRRQYDVDRVYQKNDDGSINRKNFVEIERMTRVLARNGNTENDIKIRYAPGPERDNVEVKETNITRTSGE